MYRYINPGYIGLFQNSPAGYSTSISIKYTRTGVAFSTSTPMVLPKLPTGIKELWMKWDAIHWWEGDVGVYGFYSATTNCQLANRNVYINGSYKSGAVPSGMLYSDKLQTHWLHIKSDASDGIFEMKVDGIQAFSYTGNILGGEDIINVKMSNSRTADVDAMSNIIVSDSPISLTEQVITIPCTLTTNMTQNTDGSYSADAANQYVNFAINSSITQTYAAETKITGVNIAARNCMRDGEGIDEIEFLEGATSLDTQDIGTTENIGNSHGINLDETLSQFVLHNYGLKVK